MVKVSKAAKRHQHHVLSERFADPDLVDRVFEYCLALIPELAGRRAEVTDALRAEFGGMDKVYIRSGRSQRQAEIAQQVLALFDGRNATEVARQLDISRPTVYRILKRAGGRQPA
jgi:Mor family transcriptional regulator